MFLQKRADDIALDADAAAMDDAHFRQSRLDALLQILCYDARYVFGREGMEVDGILQRQDDRLVKGRIGCVRPIRLSFFTWCHRST